MKLRSISGQSVGVGARVKPDISHCHCDTHEAVGETRSLVFKKLQSSVRPEVLEELMDRGEGVSEVS